MKKGTADEGELKVHDQWGKVMCKNLKNVGDRKIRTRSSMMTLTMQLP
jgi:hypothetical protein